MYQAVVARLRNVRKHPNADRLQLASVAGNQVVVGLDSKEGELGIYFDTDGQLSTEYAESNGLIGTVDPITGERKGGFFDAKRRVRAQKFRGEVSDGYWSPVASLAFTGDVSHLKEGDMFTEVNGVQICQKYMTEKTKKAGEPNKNKVVKKSNPLFIKHFDTKQFRFCLNSIPKGSLINITLKVHGTSQRSANLPEDLELPTWKRMVNNLLKRSYYLPDKEYKVLNGTRNVNLGVTTGDGFYGNDPFRQRALDMLKPYIQKNEIWFYELCGYTETGSLIMGSVGTTKLNDKAFTKQYGETMDFTYGCPVGTFDLYVYRIVTINPDGVVYELPWNEIKRKCNDAGVKYVPEMTDAFIFDGDYDKLNELVESLSDGVDPIDSRHVREGVVIRVDMPNGNMEFMKSKGFTFKVLEGILKLDDNYVDTEESA